MPKRKRNAEPSLLEKLDKYQNEIFRALKAAKGFERQRLSKRLHEQGVTPDKQQRLEREIAVLKSLDLHQTAQSHLSSSLLKVKSIAASTDLPEEIRAGVPKPKLAEEERAALHNVTSGLYNRKPVKEAVDRAVEFVCQSLNVPPPGKGKQPKKAKREDQEEQPSDRIRGGATEDKKPVPEAAVVEEEEEEEEAEDETDFEGFQSDVDEPGPAVGEPESDSEVEADEEDALSKYDNLLGSSSDEDDEVDEKLYERFRGKEKVNLDDISLSGSGSESDDEESAPPPQEEEEEEEEASGSPSPSPPPAKKKKEKRSAQPTGPTRDSTFLPSLMGGYVSGSESASDVDIAPPKKRRGQRARQAIWEKKYGASAKHLQETQKKKGKGGGRDSGWDMRRGAVDGEDQGRRTPWKKGVANPFAKRTRDGEGGGAAQEKPRPVKKDNEGPLHPSWEAAKKAKDAQKALGFSGQKVVFD
ncbi:hypothetical protein ACO1O0_001801 [Amphichorda felina]